MRAVVTSLLLIGVLAGCGNGDDATKATNAYVGEVNVAQVAFQRSVDAVQQTISTSDVTPAQERAALDSFRSAVQRIVSELKGITPPAKVAQLHTGLMTAISAYLPVIKARRAATGSLNARKLLDARTRFTTRSNEVNDSVQQAIDRINAKLSH